MEHETEGGYYNSNFHLKQIFHSWSTPKQVFFCDPDTFLNTKKAFSSFSQHILTQRWAALKINSIETLLFNAVFLWDCNQRFS